MREQRKKAAAIQYTDEMEAPRLVARGDAEVAERIIARAQEAGVPVYKAPLVAEALGSLALQEEIPVELYQAVAEVLAYVYTVKKESGE
ncbi:EscU/YscU/HrcU family type III secretion system export apparatus switch protein [Chitinivibrio alkaliphilus]|uniref:Flagellar biosynthetic protein FlhB n=1 Tax=Chitinivibrio alkaliphilus ACht1 TaxID=1313304 RepID=U7D8F4_9BACT|nr:EscU/YscU/HrcU family type III secretion system export apparatus switch protein [Chitinivibrio alkaliphilus]ERP31357.1 flagellar biosynthetic protein FlhB [Chitinivibrio alkaliphilus ACht1]